MWPTPSHHQTNPHSGRVLNPSVSNLKAGDCRRWDFFRASNQCLQRLICFCFLQRQVEGGGRRLEATKASPGSTSQEVMLHHRLVARCTPPGRRVPHSSMSIPSDATPRLGQGYCPPTGGTLPAESCKETGAWMPPEDAADDRALEPDGVHQGQRPAFTRECPLPLVLE